MKTRTLVLVLLAVVLLAVAAYVMDGHGLLRDLGMKIHGPR